MKKQSRFVSFEYTIWPYNITMLPKAYNVVPKNAHLLMRPSTFVLYIHLIQLAWSDSGKCWPTYHYLSSALDMSRTTISRGLKELMNLDLLELLHRGSKKEAEANTYRVYWCNGVEMEFDDKVPR